MASNKPTPKLAAQIKAAEEKYSDLPKGLLAEISSLESRGGRDLINPDSSARGPFQFMEQWGPEFGLMTEADRMNFAMSTDAAARKILKNRANLSKRLGRDVTGGELYLAHQQGADGAAKLLENPDALARDVVGGRNSAEKIRLNGGDPDKTTAGAFATKWTSKIDGAAAPKPGAPPGKKPEPRAAGPLGELPGVPSAAGSLGELPGVPSAASFYTYNPNSLTQLKRDGDALARRAPAPAISMPDIPAAKGSLATNLGTLGSVANSTSSEPAAPRPNKSTAIMAGLSTMDKILQSNAAIASTVEGVEPTRVARPGIAGDFFAGVDAGMAGIDKDREYFGLILDTLTGNEKGVKSHELNAEMAETAAAFAKSGGPSFEDFMKAPTLEGFLAQAAGMTGQVAPSALESIAAALITGGGAMVGKLVTTTASKVVAQELVKDILKKKVAGAVVDKAEDGILKALWAAGKKGAAAGAFGQEFIMGAGESISEFKEVDKDIDVGEALGALAMGVPQALVGVKGEQFILGAFADAALKKSARIAGDNVFKRFAVDMGKLMGKSALGEGTTEAIQEGLFIAQRKAIDPTYTDEEAQLRLAEAIFSGVVGGGLFAGGAAAPVSAISALNRTTLPDPNAPAASTPPPAGTPPPGGTPPKLTIADRLKGITKKAGQFIEDASEARTKAKIEGEVRGVDDSTFTGNTAPEGTVVLAAQYKEMLEPASPRKHVWIAESDFDTTLDTLQQERLKREGYFTEVQTDPANEGRTLEYTHVPGKGVMVGELKTNDTASRGKVLRSMVAQKASNERLDRYIGAMLGMADTGGVKGDTVVRAVTPQGVPIAEQTTDAAGVPAAVEAMQAQAPEAQIEEIPVAQSLEERKQRVDAEQTATDFFARFNEPGPAEPVDSKLSKAERDALMAPVEDDQVEAERAKEEARVAVATDPLSDDSQVIQDFERQYKTGDHTSPDYEINGDIDTQGYVGDMDDSTLKKVISVNTEALVDEQKRKRPAEDVLFKIKNNIRAAIVEQKQRAIRRKIKKNNSETRDMKVDPKSGKITREEGDSAESFKKTEPTGALDTDSEDPSSEDTLQDMIEERFGSEADNAEVVSKEFAKKDPPVEIAQRSAAALKTISALFKLITHDISIASLKAQLPVMMDSMLINLLKLVRQDQESIFTVEEAPGDTLHIVKRDDTVAEDTTIETRAVRKAVAMVKGPSWNRQSGMTWFLNRNGEMEQNGTSYFWLYDAAEDKSYRLIGNRSKVEGGFARPGIMALAQAGVILNVDTNTSVDGEGLTEKQKLRLGFQTMLSALIRNGYQLRVGSNPQLALPFTSIQELQNNATGEDARALTEVVATVNGIPTVIGDLLSGPLPFDSSGNEGSDTNKSGLSSSGTTEQVTTVVNNPEFMQPENEGDKPKATGRILPGQRTNTRPAPDPNIDPEERALQEDRQKNFGGRRTEAQQNAAERARENSQTDDTWNFFLQEAIDSKEFFSYSWILDPLPDDVTIKIAKVNGAYVATITSPRYKETKVESKSPYFVVGLAHKKATQQAMEANNQYSRLLLEASDNSTRKGQARYIENTGVTTQRDQTSVRDEASTTVDKRANVIDTMGRIGPMTTRLIGIASGLFSIHRPTTVMTLRHLSDNFEALTGPNGKFAGNAEQLMQAIIDLTDEKADARVLLGNQNIIITRAEPRMVMNKKGEVVYAPDDALIASIIAHEFGHILFKQEFEAIRSDASAKRVLWDAYRERVFKFGDKVPSQYRTEGEFSLPGFEEWYADQVMTFVYNEGQKAKNGADMYFKRMADAFRDFFRQVTEALGFRLWESRLPAGNKLAQDWRKTNMVLSDDAKTPNDIKTGQWTFAEYMNEVIKSHAVQRKLNFDLPFETEMLVKDMALNIRGRLPVNAARNVANSARRLLTTGSFGNVAYKLHNILWASTDFMGNEAHGRGGQILKNFFGTLSQKVVASGWNKNKIFAENRFNTELARILGITRKSGPDDWKSQRVTDILNEAADNSIPTAQLSTQEAKDIREFFKKIMDDYITDPATGIQWVDVGNLPNFGGSRMYNIEKIAADIDTFVDWVVAQPQWSGTRDMAMAMAKRIISHTGDPVANLTAEVDHDVTNGVIPNTPEGRAAEMLFRSMEQQAVTPVRESVIKGAKDGAYTFSDLLTTLRAKYPPAASNPADQSLAFLHAIDATGTDAELESDIKEFWRQRTERMRLSPGMDPALSRTGLDRIGTKAFREAIPGDVDGWLIPQAKANSQYLHYVSRKVEYNKMGGYEYVSAALNSIPQEQRQQVDDAVMANLGKFGENISPAWRTFNSVAAVWTVFTTLLFAALTSITDLSAIAVRAKEFSNLGMWFGAMKEAMTNDEWKRFAEDIGVVTMRSQDHAMIGHGELDYANNTSRALMNGFFRYTGLEFFTRFSRTMAVGMGRQFLVRTAERADFDAVKHGRWLAELGLTREDVQAWTASNHDMSTPEGLKVRDAIARFADEAVIRPDASQRPTWASSPYFQAVWQLKSYYYGFGKTVLGGMGREMKNRYAETGSISEAAGPALLMAVTIIPLTMMGLGSREWLRWLLQVIIPGVEPTPSMTSRMDGGEYTWEIFKRSGVLGPFSLALTTMEAFQYEGIAAPFTANVPMFDLFDDTLFDGDLTRPLPVINNL